MSNRALKKLHGGKDELSALASTLQLDDEENDEMAIIAPTRANRKKKQAINMFDLLNEDASDMGSADANSPENDESDGVVEPPSAQIGTKPKKKTKKKKKQQQQIIENEDDFDFESEFYVPEDSISNGQNSKGSPRKIPEKNMLAVDQKNLNPENELKKIFGSKIINAAQKKKARGRVHVKSTWLMNPKDNWHHIKKTGLSMSLDYSKDGCYYFKYEHSRDYRQIQFSFWEAVSSLNPANIVTIVNLYPYHIDSLIQLSDICRMGEDPQMATELIERALYILESAFHPSFNFATGNCRLDYKRTENSAALADEYLYKALMMFPGVLIPLLDKCSIQADTRVTTHEYFSPIKPVSVLPSLNNLMQLYVGRSFHIWKDAELLPWLERNAHRCVEEINRNPSVTLDYEDKRKKRYQGTPRNIYRHILLSDIKDATATLPQELTNTAVMSFDPLPPVDSISSYSRPSRLSNTTTAANQLEGGFLGSLLRSLMPGFNPQEVVNQQAERPPVAIENPPEEEGAAGDGAGANLQRSVVTLVTAMRDLLSSIHLPELGQRDESNEEDNDHSD
nr:EOG090X0BCY [Macrothrix elegans]